MHRWQTVLQPGLVKGKWSDEEDKILMKWVDKNGSCKWSKLSLSLKGRSSKQIRDRWINNLNPNRAKHFIWNENLDRILLSKYIEFGSSWVKISKFIPYSTENMIKNRFYSLLRSTASRLNKNCKLRKDKNEREIMGDTRHINKSSDVLSKKRNNYSLTYLLICLPDLLQERNIDVNSAKLTNNMNTVTSVDPSNNTNTDKKVAHTINKNGEAQLNLEEHKRKILNNFFNTLSQKIPHIEDEKKKAQIKFKSTILLNLQLNLLQRIFHRCKLQVIGKFFQCFKGSSPIIKIE